MKKDHTTNNIVWNFPPKPVANIPMSRSRAKLIQKQPSYKTPQLKFKIVKNRQNIAILANMAALIRQCSHFSSIIY